MIHHHAALGPVRPWTWRAYRWFQIGMWCSLLLGPGFFLTGVRNNERDRPSLQWPHVSGVLYRSEWDYVSHHTRGAFVSYSYHVNGQHYIGDRFSLWDPHCGADIELEGRHWVEFHPIHSTVDIYYDPQHPENSVLEPGADERRNGVLLWAGGILFVCTLPLVIRANSFLNKLVAWRKANPPKMPKVRKREKSGAHLHGFVSYEPGFKRKLNCLPDKAALNQFIGHDDKALQQWKPDDRIIDASGREYRLVPNTGKTRYELEPTGETWTCEKLLDVAVADARLLKKDTDALRRRVTDAPVEKRIPVLMKCIDDLSAGPVWSIVAVSLFLLLFFLAVYFGFGLVVGLIGRWMHVAH